MSRDAPARTGTGPDLDGVSVRGCGFMPLCGALAGPHALRQVGTGRGLFIEAGDERALDGDLVQRLITSPGVVLDTGVRTSQAATLRSLRLWLALNDSAAARRLAMEGADDADLLPWIFAGAWSGHAAALVDADGMAVL